VAARGWEGLRSRLGRGASVEEHDVGQALEELAARGTALNPLFGADDQGVDMLRSAARSSLRTLHGRRDFRFDVVDGPEHTFEQLWAQDLLATRVVAWFRERFLREASHRSEAPSLETVRPLGGLEASG
jgi:hypothetical protein